MTKEAHVDLTRDSNRSRASTLRHRVGSTDFNSGSRIDASAAKPRYECMISARNFLSLAF